MFHDPRSWPPRSRSPRGGSIALAVQSLMVESFRGMSRFAAATLLDELFVDFTSMCVFAILFVTVGHAGKVPLYPHGRLG